MIAEGTPPVRPAPTGGDPTLGWEVFPSIGQWCVHSFCSKNPWQNGGGRESGTVDDNGRRPFPTHAGGRGVPPGFRRFFLGGGLQMAENG